jgi:release factor glutamine methyltransferase
VLRELPEENPSRVLDLCTGSGCIAVTLAAERTRCSVWATDLSPEACEVSRANAEANQVGARVTVLPGDLFGPLPVGVRFEAITANPPYIPSALIPGLSREVRREPRLALDGGVDGLTLVRRITSQARGWLKPGGLLAMEISEGQGGAVKALLTEAGYQQVRVEADLARLERLVFGKQPADSPSLEA